jgi:hypothetical protein
MTAQVRDARATARAMAILAMPGHGQDARATFPRCPYGHAKACPHRSQRQPAPLPPPALARRVYYFLARGFSP